jgi:quercetin dioxygenase-like cupin family protein
MDEPDRISFLGRQCPENFRLSVVIVQPRDDIEWRPADWADALIVVERGELEVELRSGTRAWFREGAILVLAGLSLRRLRNSSRDPLVLSLLSRDR